MGGGLGATGGGDMDGGVVKGDADGVCNGESGIGLPSSSNRRVAMNAPFYACMYFLTIIYTALLQKYLILSVQFYDEIITESKQVAKDN